MVALSLAAWFTTRPGVRHANRFEFGPIVEVAVLFAGIFVTMIAPLQVLNARGAELGLLHPWQYFWATGILSSFLDNAPTYLTFFNTALGALAPGLPEAQAVQKLIHTGGPYLHAISCGAVFMGANTYIGNAPNFMVKSIAEESGVQMPSFFGYMLKYSIPFLIPLFLIATFVFFR